MIKRIKLAVRSRVPVPVVTWKPIRYVSKLLLLSAISTAMAQAQTPITGLESVVPLTALETPTDDLLRLATTYADAVKDMKIAKLNLTTLSRLRGNAVVTNLEVETARLELEAAQRKMSIVQKIVEKQLAAAENKLEIVKHLETIGNDNAIPNGQPNKQRFVRAQDEATVRILKMILQMN